MVNQDVKFEMHTALRVWIFMKLLEFWEKWKGWSSPTPCIRKGMIKRVTESKI